MLRGRAHLMILTTICRSLGRFWRGDGFDLKGRPTAYRPPLYPVLLAPSVSNLGEALSLGNRPAASRPRGRHRMVDSRGGQKVRGSRSDGCMLAAFVVACDPVLVWQSRSVMTETPTAFSAGRGSGRACHARGCRGPVSAASHSVWPRCAGRACLPAPRLTIVAAPFATRAAVANA